MMRAYMMLGSSDLDSLREEELKMKGHRRGGRVFDGVTGRFVMEAGLKQSVHDRIFHDLCFADGEDTVAQINETRV